MTPSYSYFILKEKESMRSSNSREILPYLTIYNNRTLRWRNSLRESLDSFQMRNKGNPKIIEELPNAPLTLKHIKGFMEKEDLIMVYYGNEIPSEKTHPELFI